MRNNASPEGSEGISCLKSYFSTFFERINSFVDTSSSTCHNKYLHIHKTNQHQARKQQVQRTPLFMNEKECIFMNLQRMADAVVSLLGKNCEACIHDLTLLENSLVYIQGDVTGRKPGAPATDLLMKMLQQNSGKAEDKHNYKTTTADGRSLKSTTTFIRDTTGQPVAAFCINLDTTDFFNAHQALMPFINTQEKSHQAKTETFAHAAGETVEALFFHAVEEIGKHPATMNIDEKTELTRLLDKNGTFLLKGAVEQVAQMLGVTKFTVYNYLKKVRSFNSTITSEV